MKKKLQVMSGLVLGMIGGSLVIRIMWGRRIPLGINWQGQDLGGTKLEEVKQKIREAVNNYDVEVVLDEQKIKLREKGWLTINEQENWQAIKTTTTGISWWKNMLKGIRGKKTKIRVVYDLKTTPLKMWVRANNQEGRETKIIIEGNTIKVNNGQDGWRWQEEVLVTNIQKAIEEHKERVEGQKQIIKYRLSQDEAESLKEISQKLLGKQMKIQGGEKQWLMQEKELISFLATKPGQIGTIDTDKIEAYIRGVKNSLDRPPEEARFQVKEGRVIQFKVDKSGLKVNEVKSVQQLKESLKQLLTGQEKQITSQLVVDKIPAKVRLANTNRLGIVELLGRGVSFYKHSIPARAYNVELASRLIDGVLIAPGEVFSFNRAVGEISKARGFKSAYIIKDGKTILGDGGGVCQVSTTVFRAALQAGLPIKERWAHAYRVGYYEQNSQPGFDATVYAPNKDFKFVNDTGNYLLVDSWYDHKLNKLVVDIYGKKDGRQVFISKARVWEITPPPPAIYQDDPSLPKGVIKQVDWQAWGAKTAFDYRVEKAGKIIFAKTFLSVYRPWQDVFLVGTGESPPLP